MLNSKLLLAQHKPVIDAGTRCRQRTVPDLIEFVHCHMDPTNGPRKTRETDSPDKTTEK